MKSTKIIYWVTTGLFAAFMISTALPDVLKSEDAVKFIMALGYPEYFIPFIGGAKIIGSLVLLIPGRRVIKEWAYAGLFFDLAGAAYSVIAVHGFDPGMLMLGGFIAIMFTSWVYNRKLYPETN